MEIGQVTTALRENQGKVAFGLTVLTLMVAIPLLTVRGIPEGMKAANDASCFAQNWFILPAGGAIGGVALFKLARGAWKGERANFDDEKEQRIAALERGEKREAVPTSGCRGLHAYLKNNQATTAIALSSLTLLAAIPLFTASGIPNSMQSANDASCFIQNWILVPVGLVGTGIALFKPDPLEKRLKALEEGAPLVEEKESGNILRNNQTTAALAATLLTLAVGIPIIASSGIPNFMQNANDASCFVQNWILMPAATVASGMALLKLFKGAKGACKGTCENFDDDQMIRIQKLE